MRKQSATATSDANILTVLNTFLNPFASVMPGKYWVPEALKGLSRESRENPTLPFTGNAPFDRLAFQGGAVGLSAMALMALARLTKGFYSQNKIDKNSKKELSDIVGARNPIFSPDPNLKDIEEEHKQQALGVTQMDEARLSKQAELVPWLKAIVPLSLMLSGGVIGYKGVDNLMERKHAAKLESDIDLLSNDLDRLNYIKLMKARGLNPEEYPDIEPNAIPKAAGDTDDVEESGWHPITSLAALLFLSTAVSSGIMAKRYFDAEDPRRQEFKEMQSALRQLETSEQHDTPVNVAPVPSDLAAKLNQHINQKGSRRKPAYIESHEVPAQTIEAAPVDLMYNGLRDKSDPTMALL